MSSVRLSFVSVSRIAVRRNASQLSSGEFDFVSYLVVFVRLASLQTRAAVSWEVAMHACVFDNKT